MSPASALAWALAWALWRSLHLDSGGQCPPCVLQVAAQHPEVVAELHARLMALLEGEVTVAASGLCPTALGTQVDARMSALAAQTGFWQPWLSKNSLLQGS